MYHQAPTPGAAPRASHPQPGLAGAVPGPHQSAHAAGGASKAPRVVSMWDHLAGAAGGAGPPPRRPAGHHTTAPPRVRRAWGVDAPAVLPTSGLGPHKSGRVVRGATADPRVVDMPAWHEASAGGVGRRRQPYVRHRRPATPTRPPLPCTLPRAWRPRPRSPRACQPAHALSGALVGPRVVTCRHAWASTGGGGRRTAARRPGRQATPPRPLAPSSAPRVGRRGPRWPGRP